MCLEFQALVWRTSGDGWRRWLNNTVIQSHREMVKPVDFILLFIVIFNCNIDLIFIVNH